MQAAAAPADRKCRPSSHHSSIPAAKAPHFSRLGDVEVNAGQNASFQCMAAGRAAEAERFLLQVSGGGGAGGPCATSYEKCWLSCRVLSPSFILQHHTCILVFLGSALPSCVPCSPRTEHGSLGSPNHILCQRQSYHIPLISPTSPVAGSRNSK